MSEALASWIRAMQATEQAARDAATLPALLPKLAALHGDRIALCGDGTMLSYQALAARIDAVAGWAEAAGLAPGQVVGLLMPNRTEYVATWLGLSRAGVVVALLNTNLAGDALLHGIHAGAAVGLIVDAALVAPVQEIAARLEPAFRIWVHGGTQAPWPAFLPAAAPALPPAFAPAPRDRALLVFTSGTTGLPKAAVVTHARIVEWAYWFAGLMDAGPEDRVYDCLPLYHSVGGIIAVGSMLVSGGSVLIRARFSASRLWDDVADTGCTILQYIGELCRYLLAAPDVPAARPHRLRLACGNGLGGDIWETVQRRFALPRILEFYAATEGGVSLYNVEGRPGAIGRVPGVLRHRLGIALIRVDADSQPVRDAAGRCIACADDEPGEAIGRLGPARRFDGYTDAAASAAKLLADVFAPGDAWFRTGDLLRRDAAGYYFFVDRLGDTFRWKGENVSTTEVTAVLRACPGVADAAVYGVQVPGHDGRAGMATLTVDGDFAWAALHAHLARALPGYAQPLFVRLGAGLEVTGTFKLVKGVLARQGFLASPDPVWLNDRQAGQFIALDTALRDRIAAGSWRG